MRYVYSARPVHFGELTHHRTNCGGRAYGGYWTIGWYIGVNINVNVDDAVGVKSL